VEFKTITVLLITSLWYLRFTASDYPFGKFFLEHAQWRYIALLLAPNYHLYFNGLSLVVVDIGGI
jgi:hypothetical protein